MSKILNSFVFWILVIWICFEFRTWNLEFPILAYRLYWVKAIISSPIVKSSF